jgi:NAD(P)-dependent dehydrogenase (short-subunit alcohol dehydrogenase family)
VIADLDEISGTELAASFGSSGLFHKTDVTNWKSLNSLFSTAFGTFGSIDHVCANAGVPEQHSFLLEDRVGGDGELLEPSFKLLDVNVNGVLRSKWWHPTPGNATFNGSANSRKTRNSLLRKEQDSRRLTRGHWFRRKVYILAFLYEPATHEPSLLPFPWHSYFGAAPIVVYDTSKHAVLGLVRSLAKITRPLNVRVNLVAPWMTETEFNTEVREHWGDFPINTQEDVAVALVVACADETLHGMPPSWLSGEG